PLSLRSRSNTQQLTKRLTQDRGGDEKGDKGEPCLREENRDTRAGDERRPKRPTWRIDRAAGESEQVQDWESRRHSRRRADHVLQERRFHRPLRTAASKAHRQ